MNKKWILYNIGCIKNGRFERFFSQISWSEEAKLIVWDVGHGNWNEVRVGNNRIFFDIGADKYYRLSDKQNLIEKIAIKEDDVIFIIISHWDVDHYQSLLFFQNETCQKIAGIIAPEFIPHTNTARMVVNYIEQHHIKFFVFPVFINQVKR